MPVLSVPADRARPAGRRPATESRQSVMPPMADNRMPSGIQTRFGKAAQVTVRAIESRTLFWLLALAAGLLLFLKLASEVVEGETMAFDRRLLLAFREPASPSVPLGPHWLLKAMTDLTSLGSATVLTLMTIAVAAYLLAAKRPATALFVIAAVSGGAIFSAILKQVFERARPELVPHLVNVDSASFPSGHAMNSAVTYLTLGTLLANAERSRAVRTYLVCTAVLLTFLIGVSRLYLGVHWPSDVVAGWCVGACWALACSLAAQYFRERRAIERPAASRAQ